ncbi:DUF5995 family protein [Streptomyces sp. NPDC058525]|uniref:DUF5995 family protein n=1 Tax=Streptomyces sp. NPDC058525 TaxID=3346538 RepID=UPI00365DB696
MAIRTEDINWRPRTAPEALTALELLSSRLREVGDHRAVFIDVYEVITRQVVNVMHAEDHTGFLDPTWLSELTGLFAEEALIATRCSLLGEPVTSASWRIATRCSGNRVTAPWQSAFLGINAHINYDLGLVVHSYLRAHRDRIDATQLRRYHQDYQRVNRLLEQSVFECADVLIDRYRCQATTAARYVPLGRRVGAQGVMLMLVSWRDQAWRDILALWNARDERVRARILRRMDRRAGRIAQAITAGPTLGRSLRALGSMIWRAVD